VCSSSFAIFHHGREWIVFFSPPPPSLIVKRDSQCTL
jgi:hypothetical protein